MRRALLLVSLFSACNAASADFMSGGGASFYLCRTDGGGFNAASATEIEGRFTAAMVDAGWKREDIARSIAQAQVYLQPDAFACPWASGDGGFYTSYVQADGGVAPTTCWGTENGTRLDVVANPYVDRFPLGCPGGSAYAHELGHLVQLLAEGVSDYQHKDPRVWDVPELQPDGTTKLHEGPVGEVEAAELNACTLKYADGGE